MVGHSKHLNGKIEQAHLALISAICLNGIQSQILKSRFPVAKRVFNDSERHCD